jgi:hypothetical protein
MPHPNSARHDLSQALIHLTGKRGAVSASTALISILKDGEIRGSNTEGFIKGNKSATCFTEMPLSCIESFVSDSKESKHPYDYFGIALSKQQAWARGARPVIYLPDHEANWIPADQKWRHVRYELNEVDFSHEREWRAQGSFSIDGIGFYVIVPNIDAENIIRAGLHETAINHIIGFLHMEIPGPPHVPIIEIKDGMRKFA